MKPIIFHATSVEATLDGDKTQTRRLCKPAYHSMDMLGGAWAGAVLPAREKGWVAWWPGTGDQQELADFTKREYKSGFPCPYGKVGDLLWVREKLRRISFDFKGSPPGVLYDQDRVCAYREGKIGRWTWKRKILPAMFMPRWASRITLRLMGVRVERVQEITEDDARVEGIVAHGACHNYNGVDDYPYNRKVDAFAHRWDTINAKRGYPWESNPWVWVLTFERMEEERAG